MSASVVADNVRIWLHTKLERPWNGSHVAYHLTNDVLALVVDQWISLDTTVKLRLLAALLAIKPAQLRSILTQTQQIIALTAEDSDGWVQTVGQIISSALVPENAHFDLSALESNPETSTVIQNLQKISTSSYSTLFSSINLVTISEKDLQNPLHGKVDFRASSIFGPLKLTFLGWNKYSKRR